MSQNMTAMLYKPGDVVCLYEPPLEPNDGLLTLPVAIKTNQGLQAIADTSLWRGILSTRSLFIALPRHPVYGLVICYEGDGEHIPLDGDEPSIRERRLFVMISFNGEPEYVRVVEKAGYLSKVVEDNHREETENICLK